MRPRSSTTTMTTRAAARAAAFVLAALASALPACTDGPAPPPAPPCDEACRDANALRGLRETAKLAFNLTLQGKPVGDHDETIPCIRGGSARVHGRATSNADQGATHVELTYVFTHCAYYFRDDDPEDNYDLVFDGTLTQSGTLAAQPSSTTALVMKSDGMSIHGTVYDPPEPYEVTDCAMDLAQDGRKLFGTMCGRDAAVEL